MNFDLKGRPIAELVERLKKGLSTRTSLEEGHIEALRRVNDDISKYREELRRQIEEGGTTGDQLRDILIANYSDWTPEVEEKVRLFENSLRGKNGQFLLFSYTTHVRTSYGGPFSDENYTPRQTVRIGVLEGERLIHIEYAGLTLPISRYLTADEFVRAGRLVEQNIFARSPLTSGGPPALLVHLLDIRPGRYLRLEPPPTIKEMIVGDAEVAAYLRKWGMDDFYTSACIHFSKSELAEAAAE